MPKLLVALVLALAPLAPLAAQGSPKATIEARQANFKAIAKANKGVQDALKSPRPSVEALRANAAELQNASERIATLFPAGTGPEAGVTTEALPAIWQKPAAFTEAVNKHVAAVRALNAAAKGGDVAAIRTAADAIGPTCKGCHDQFRLPK